MDLSFLTCLKDFRLVFEDQIQGWQACRRVTNRFNFDDTGIQNKAVGIVVHSTKYQSSLVFGLLILAGVFTLDGFHHG